MNSLTKSTEPQCGDCIYFESTGEDSGFCCFLPPVPLVVAGQIESVLPLTVVDGFCGQFYPVAGGVE